MPIEAKARKIIQSLEAKPALFYEILRIVADEFVIVGPWEHDGGQSWVRRDPSGESIAIVEPFAGKGPDWAWRISTDTAHGFPSADGAKDAVDTLMVKLGYVLP